MKIQFPSPASLFLGAFIFLSACASAQAPQGQTSDSRLVLTSLAPVFHITQALLEDTDISVHNIPARPRSMAAQATFFARQGERFKSEFTSAEAVITIGKIWPEDSFYTTAREANIHIVNIDASKPWSHTLVGVTVSSSPVTGEISPFFWTSPANTIRMLSIVARDLQALYPDQAEIIAANLKQQQNFYISLKADFETKFIEVFDPFIYALADEFSYLTSELGIFVDGYFIKQDIDWTDEDYNNLSERLQSSGIKVVIHKWQPSDEIQAAIKTGGAQLVVLNLMETSTESFTAGLQNNLDLLLNALSQSE